MEIQPKYCMNFNIIRSTRVSTSKGIQMVSIEYMLISFKKFVWVFLFRTENKNTPVSSLKLNEPQITTTIQRKLQSYDSQKHMHTHTQKPA